MGDEAFKSGSAAKWVLRPPASPTKGAARGERSATERAGYSAPEVWLELARLSRYRVGYFASLLDLSTRQLERDFAECGISPQSWLKHVRVCQAARLLEKGEQLKNLPGLLAFGNASSFWRAFRCRLRCTPREYLEHSSHGAERLHSRRPAQGFLSGPVRISSPKETLRVLSSLPAQSSTLRIHLSGYVRRLEAQRQSVGGAHPPSDTGLSAPARATA